MGQYSDETATLLARELLKGANGESRIAIVSAPSVFVQVKNLLVSFLSPSIFRLPLPHYLLFHIK